MIDNDRSASRDQAIILQTLYAQWKSHSIEVDSSPRLARLAWASNAVGRPISSFSELTRDEARQLVDGLKSSMGLALTEKPQPWRRICSRERAQAAGTAQGAGTPARLFFRWPAQMILRESMKRFSASVGHAIAMKRG